jgi:molybdopterin converting factor small subunit
MTTPAGVEYDKTIEVTMFELILAGDTYEFWDHDGSDWSSALQYYVDDKNETEIRTMLRALAERDDEFIEEEFNEKNLEELIEEYDDNYDIRHAIGNAQSNAEADDYGNYLYRLLKDGLEEYGTVEQMNDEGVILHVDVSKYIDEVGETQFDELIGVIEEKDEMIEELQTNIEELKEDYEDQISDLKEELRKVTFLLIEYQHQNK